MSDIKFKYDKEKMENIRRFFDSKPEVKIGVLSNEWKKHPARDWKNGKWRPWNRKIGPAGLAAVHEFGCETKFYGKSVTIPARSFLRLTMQNKAEDFKNYIASNSMKNMDLISIGSGKEFMGKIGAVWVRYVMQTFKSQGPGWGPLSEATLGLRRQVKDKITGETRPSSVILRVTGALARSITWKVKGS